MTAALGGTGAREVGNPVELPSSRELDEQEEFPSDDQLDALLEAAPEEIQEDGELVVEKCKEAGEENIEEVFTDPELVEALNRLEDFDAENCGISNDQEGASSEVDPDAQLVEVTATEYDFEFEAPDAGAVSFVMTNEGEEDHFLALGLLKDGVTMEEALQAEDTEEVLDAEFDSEVAAPGGEAVLTIDDMQAGEWVMVCFITAPDGEPHAFKGMAVPVTVS